MALFPVALVTMPPMNLPDGLCRVVMDVARRAIRARLCNEPLSPIDPCDPALRQPAGCFVTLHEQLTHRLRGCIGTFESDRPLIETVAAMAVAALGDPRFCHDPVTAAELVQLELEASILSPLRPMAGPMDFDLHSEGIYVRFGHRTGCFLPQVARDTGWTREQLLDRLCAEKMGLSPLIWRNPHAQLFAFSVQIIGPEPFEPAGG